MQLLEVHPYAAVQNLLEARRLLSKGDGESEGAGGAAGRAEVSRVAAIERRIVEQRARVLLGRAMLRLGLALQKKRRKGGGQTPAATGKRQLHDRGTVPYPHTVSCGSPPILFYHRFSVSPILDSFPSLCRATL